MNKNGFTLMELLAVIIIIGLIFLFVYPALDNIVNDNNSKLYQQYEKMMVEYAKTISSDDTVVKLSNIDGLNQVKNDCKGYVLVSNKVYTAYISCNNGYKTSGYNASYE